jgi:hypothetical protein
MNDALEDDRPIDPSAQWQASLQRSIEQMVDHSLKGHSVTAGYLTALTTMLYKFTCT